MSERMCLFIAGAGWKGLTNSRCHAPVRPEGLALLEAARPHWKKMWNRRALGNRIADQIGWASCFESSRGCWLRGDGCPGTARSMGRGRGRDTGTLSSLALSDHRMKHETDDATDTPSSPSSRGHRMKCGTSEIQLAYGTGGHRMKCGTSEMQLLSGGSGRRYLDLAARPYRSANSCVM